MTIALIIFSFVAIALSWLAMQKAPGVLREGWGLGWKSFLGTLPLLLLAMGIGGLVQVLVDKEWIDHWLGQSSGWRGVWAGCIAGIFAPGGPFVTFPIAAGFLKAGAAIPTVVAFITAWSHWGLRMMLLESAFISPRFTLVMFLSNLVMPPLAGGIALFICRRFL